MVIYMCEENMIQEFRFKHMEEMENYFNKEIDKNDLMSNDHKKVCSTLNYIEHFLVLVAVLPECISISAFASLVCIPIGITSSAEK